MYQFSSPAIKKAAKDVLEVETQTFVDFLVRIVDFCGIFVFRRLQRISGTSNRPWRLLGPNWVAGSREKAKKPDVEACELSKMSNVN